VFVGAGCSIWAYAATEFDLPPAKVLTEFLKFLSGRLAVLLDGSFGAAPGHKLLVVLNNLSGVGRRVISGGRSSCVRLFPGREGGVIWANREQSDRSAFPITA